MKLTWECRQLTDRLVPYSTNQIGLRLSAINEQHRINTRTCRRPSLRAFVHTAYRLDFLFAEKFEPAALCQQRFQIFCLQIAAMPASDTANQPKNGASWLPGVGAPVAGIVQQDPIHNTAWKSQHVESVSAPDSTSTASPMDASQVCVNAGGSWWSWAHTSAIPSQSGAYARGVVSWQILTLLAKTSFGKTTKSSPCDLPHAPPAA